MGSRENDRVAELGWKDGTVAEFLGLTPEESALIEMKLGLSKQLKLRRQKQMSLAQLAQKLQSSQSKIEQAESGQSLVSMELLVRGLIVTTCHTTRYWASDCQ